MALDNDFWRYACALYSSPEVASKLLFLQDNYQLDVIALLFIAWLENDNKPLSKASLDSCLQRCQHWQDTIIAPIRQARREIKQQNADLYQQAKELELYAEQTLMAKLYQQIQQTEIDENQGLTINDATRYYLQQAKPGLAFTVVEPYLACLK